MYISNEISNDISVVRTSDNTVVDTVPVGDCPKGICSLPSGEYIYVAEGEINRGSYDLISFGADGVEGGEGDNADIFND